MTAEAVRSAVAPSLERSSQSAASVSPAPPDRVPAVVPPPEAPQPELQSLKLERIMQKVEIHIAEQLYNVQFPAKTAAVASQDQQLSQLLASLAWITPSYLGTRTMLPF